MFLAIIDQVSKTYLIKFLKTQPGYYKKLISKFDFGFDLVYSWNYGASFGFMREYYQYSNWAFLFINSLIIIYLMFFLRRIKDVLYITGLILIIGGAIGNLIDRIIRGAVFDFIYLYYNQYAFPAFNFADSFITIGAVIIIIQQLFFKKSLEEKADSE
jgi:signal peptidase II